MEQVSLEEFERLVGVVKKLAKRQGVLDVDDIMLELEVLESSFSSNKPDIASWDASPIELSCGLLVAPCDFMLETCGGEKRFFTFGEAEQLVKPALEGTKWRIPNIDDAKVIKQEFDTMDKMATLLDLRRDGHLTFDGRSDCWVDAGEYFAERCSFYNLYTKSGGVYYMLDESFYIPDDSYENLHTAVICGCAGHEDKVYPVLQSYDARFHAFHIRCVADCDR